MVSPVQPKGCAKENTVVLPSSLFPVDWRRSLRSRWVVKTARRRGSGSDGSNASWSSWRWVRSGNRRSPWSAPRSRSASPGRDAAAARPERSRPWTSRTWTLCSVPNWTSSTCGWPTTWRTADRGRVPGLCANKGFVVFSKKVHIKVYLNVFFLIATFRRQTKLVILSRLEQKLHSVQRFMVL